jgi:uncharacterized membrane protein (UPF0127 family)
MHPAFDAFVFAFDGQKRWPIIYALILLSPFLCHLMNRDPFLHRIFSVRPSVLLVGVVGFWVLFLGTQVNAQNTPQMSLERTQLMAGMHRLDVQLALTPEQRQIGLMWRKDMPQHEGMLFVFDQPSTQCFWMRNTLIPLTAAFLEDDGTIVNLADMKPLNDDSHCSTKPVRFVLEMNQGWFAKRQIKPGFKLNGQIFVKRLN